MIKCIHQACRAANLCKEGYCVGAELEKLGYEMRFGQIVHKPIPKETDDEEQSLQRS
jgi:hypothetical protein